MKNIKKAIVSGSTKGIGRAIGWELLSHVCEVAFNFASDMAAAQLLRDELEAMGCQDQYRIIQADLSRVEECSRLLDEAGEDFQSIDYLVLNAAATWRCRLRDLRLEDWERVLRTNLTVPLFLTQMCAPRMVPGGSILFIGAVMGQYPHALSIPYGVSKAGVHYLAKSLVKEFAGQRVRVNCLCPGFVETEMQKNKPASIRASVEGKIALGRFAEAEEIAAMARAILENSYINGAEVNIDGGYCFQ